jgi:peptidoglycan hydrolase FlgJ
VNPKILWIAALIVGVYLARRGAGGIVGNVLKRKEFIATLQPIAARIHAEYGIAPKILIAQAAHESGWGTSQLARDGKNLFGMVGFSWRRAGKPVIEFPTREYSPKTPDQIKFFEAPGDVVSKKPHPRGGTDLVVRRPFRKYASWYESARDWAELISARGLTRPGRYAKAYEAARAGDLNAFAREVKAAGYATDPAYEQKLVRVASEAANV